MNQSLPRPVERVVAQLQQHGRKVEPRGDSWKAPRSARPTTTSGRASRSARGAMGGRS